LIATQATTRQRLIASGGRPDWRIFRNWPRMFRTARSASGSPADRRAQRLDRLGLKEYLPAVTAFQVAVDQLAKTDPQHELVQWMIRHLLERRVDYFQRRSTARGPEEPPRGRGHIGSFDRARTAEPISTSGLQPDDRCRPAFAPSSAARRTRRVPPRGGALLRVPSVHRASNRMVLAPIAAGSFVMGRRRRSRVVSRTSDHTA